MKIYKFTRGPRNFFLSVGNCNPLSCGGSYDLLKGISVIKERGSWTVRYDGLCSKGFLSKNAEEIGEVDLDRVILEFLNKEGFINHEA